MSAVVTPARRPEVLTLRRRIPVVLTAVLLLAVSTVLTNRFLPGWAYPVTGAVTAVTLIVLARGAGLSPAAIGLDRDNFRRAALFGLAGFAVVLLGFGVAMAVPSLRTLFHDGRIGSPGFGQLLWLALIRIPLGTVLLEEVAFRGVLPALLGAGERWRWGPVLGAAGLFGLWHLLPSLALEQNAAVHATFGGLPLALVSLLAMLAAAGAGVFLYWWRHTGRGLAAPMMIHLATNSGGLVFAWLLLAH
ncbi:CPBP family glutamic-type intramembrane protease [Amycolatopsis cynarae]|uniref:CPBP family glutamic-type intramembrane protease n=1 Tax=Amycolatopsis cynarae TaxID=2995223 RepID=A0ABY7B9B2_9PSEU|nr:CPBP family glutamic-type intramembrane protease [Amycolatopsis sp. HUAS 11-8]WAL68957.1 CPBP family glutamic-type intramembrane protease [Amycolatopsis sp. HUAS 11-8]